ncbi:uncharacterized protein [Haliotis cracherodii]|uniref:uncharacterized protein isoform X1 n=2 Tax=Haliotis cracherodii TaxID=6455 RepID=UPI0039EAF7A3
MRHAGESPVKNNDFWFMESLGFKDARHFSCHMLSKLKLCQLHETLTVLFVFVILLCAHGTVAESTSTDTVRYSIDGSWITCKSVTCPRGYETVACTKNGGKDTCHLCSWDKYQPVDNVTSQMRLKCFPIVCAPDTQRLVQRGEPGPGNPPVCVCDTTRNYYQNSDIPEDCRRRICGRSETLLLNGTCSCMKGRVRNKDGHCVWNQPQPSLSSESTRQLDATLGYVQTGPHTTSTSDVLARTTARHNTTDHGAVTVSTGSISTDTSTVPRLDQEHGVGKTWIPLGIVDAVFAVWVVLALSWVVYKVVEKKKWDRRVMVDKNGGEEGLLTADESSAASSQEVLKESPSTSETSTGTQVIIDQSQHYHAPVTNITACSGVQIGPNNSMTNQPDRDGDDEN